MSSPGRRLSTTCAICNAAHRPQAGREERKNATTRKIATPQAVVALACSAA
jgi:hypothetical protein